MVSHHWIVATPSGSEEGEISTIQPSLEAFVPKLVMPLSVKLHERMVSTRVGGMTAEKPWKLALGSDRLERGKGDVPRWSFQDHA